MTSNFATNVELMSLERLSAIYAAKKQGSVLRSTALLNLKVNKRESSQRMATRRSAPLKNPHATSNQSLSATSVTITATLTAHVLTFRPYKPSPSAKA